MSLEVLISRNHRAVIVPERTDLLNLFPHAKPLTFEGKRLLAVPHGREETKLLNNLGLDVVAPVVAHYDWCGGKPFEVQKRTAAMLTTEERCYVLNGMGTGKTKAALWAFDWLRSVGEAKRMMVCAPLSTLNFTWAREVHQTVPHLKVVVLHGTRDKRRQRLEEDADIYIINHDGLKTVFDDLLKRHDIDCWCIDELACFRNGTAERTKTMRKLLKGRRWVWGMTGSPTPSAPTDAWSQANLITPWTVDKSFIRFRDEVMRKVDQFLWKSKPDAADTVARALQPSVRYTLDDVVELPELVVRTIDVEMGKQQAKIYKEVKDKAHAMLQEGSVTPVNAAGVLNKLLQISTGFVYLDGKEKNVQLDNNLRMDAMVEAIDGSEKKVIVFVPFIHALEGIAKRLTAEGISYRTVHGGTPKGQRDETFKLFQQTNEPKVLVAHPGTMAHGLTLTAATTIIWFGPITSLEIFEQANARIRRIGQKDKQQILMFQGTAAEKRMYKRLREKQDVQNRVLQLLAEATEDADD